MNPERWQRFKQVITTVLEQDQQKWPTFLAAQCGDDVNLFLDASVILASSRSIGDFIKAPAWQGLLAGEPRTPPLESAGVS